MPDELEFHSEATGWVPAEELPVGHPETLGFPQQGKIHLRAKLPDGREVARSNVTPERHLIVLNPLTGRCRQCQQLEAAHGIRPGRVYRERATRTTNVPERDIEPAKEPVPVTTENLQEQAPRRARGERTGVE